MTKNILLLILITPFFLEAELLRDDNKHTIIDTTTNLEWQDNYNLNGGIIKVVSSWEDAINYCETLTINGEGGWRLPNRNELFSIIDYTQTFPSISEKFQKSDTGSYWSSSTQYRNLNDTSSDKDKATFVIFTYGHVSDLAKSTSGLKVRCVRGGEEYTRDTDLEVIVDNRTGQVWQDNIAVSNIQKPYLTEENYNIGDYNNTIGDTADSYCKNLTIGSFNDWRLPKFSELFTFLDRPTQINLVDSNIPNGSQYWTSTRYVPEESRRYTIKNSPSFTSKVSSFLEVANVSLHIRCVRDGN